MLRRLGLQLAGGRNIRHQRQVDVDGVAPRQIVAELPDRLDEGHRLNVADRSADLAENEVEIVVCVEDERLDLVRDVRDHLHGRAEVVAATLLVEDVLVQPARRDVVGLNGRTSGEPLVMAEVQIGLGAVVRDEHLAVLGRAHGARIHVQVGIEFAQPHPVSTGLQQCAEGGRSYSFSKGRNHAAGDENVTRHGLEPISPRN